MENTKTLASADPREKIARIISISVPIATGVMAFIAIVFAIVLTAQKKEKESIDILKYTFTALLPLWGTWIGIVLAYYFSKENFKLANENVRKLVSQISTVNEKLQGTKAKVVMIPASEIVKKEFRSEAELKACKIPEIIAFIKETNQNRLPLFVRGQLKYIVHVSTFDRFVRIMLEKGYGYKIFRINDMVNCDDEWIKNSLLKGAAFISEQANLLEAKIIMETNPYCNDVFVTANGHPSDAVLGWITGKTIHTNAKV